MNNFSLLISGFHFWILQGGGIQRQSSFERFLRVSCCFTSFGACKLFFCISLPVQQSFYEDAAALNCDFDCRLRLCCVFGVLPRDNLRRLFRCSETKAAKKTAKQRRYASKVRTEAPVELFTVGNVHPSSEDAAAALGGNSVEGTSSENSLAVYVVPVPPSTDSCSTPDVTSVPEYVCSLA
jgi:hypothetical protein